MDHVTRQLIVLAKELRDDFRQTREALSNEVKKISETLQQTSEAKHARQERDTQNEYARQVTVVASEKAAERQKHAERNRDYRVQHSIRKAAWGAFIAATLYGAIAILQWRATLKSNDISRQSLIAVQRSFVHFQGIQSRRFANQLQDGNNWIFEAAFVNSGPTPAIQLANMFSADELPDGLTEDRFIGKETDVATAKLGRGVIGPKDQHAIGPALKSDTFVLGNHKIDWKQSEKVPAFEITLHQVFWGWLIYRDVFPETRTHLTEFCQELSGITINRKDQTIQVIFQNCSAHSCTDEYCEDYKQLMDFVDRAKKSPSPSPIDKKDRTLR
jgi:hypothetical protein